MQKMIKKLIVNRRRISAFVWRLTIMMLSAFTIQAYAQLTVIPSFGSATVPQNTNTTLTIIFGTSVGMTDFTFLASAAPLTLTGGNFVSAVPTVNTCPTSVTSISANQISLVGLAGPGFGNTSASCTLTFDVTAVGAPGSTMSFPIATNSLRTTVTPFSSVPTPNVPGPTNGATATATIQSPPPTMTVAFSPTRVAPNFNSTLTILVSNPNATAITINSIQIQPALDLRLTNVVDNCGTGAIITTVLFGPGSIDFLTTGVVATLLPGASCTITAQARSATPGTYVVPVAAGNLTTSAGSNVNTSSAALIVALPTAPPTVALTVASTNVVINTPVALTITFTNPDTVPSIITGSSINIPNGLTAGFGANAGTCGGSNGGSGNTVSLVGATIPALGSCTQIVNLQTPSLGTFAIPYALGALSTSTGSNAAGASVTLQVVAPTIAPTVSLSWSTITQTLSASVTAPAPITLSIFFSNNNLAPVTALNSSITIPSGLTVTNVTTTCPTGVNSAAGVNPVTLTGGTIPAAIVGSVPIPGVCRQDITFTTTAAATPYSITYGNLTSSAGAVTGSTPAILVVSGVSANPLALTFGAQIVGTSSPVQNVTVTAIGGTAQLTTINIVGATGTFSAVLLAPCGPLPYTIPAGASCTAAAVFSPVSATPVTQNGTLAIGTSAGNLNVSLTGTASPIPVPGLTLAPTALNFGPQPTNTRTIQNIIATNTGTATLAINNLTINSGDFQVVATTLATPAPCGVSIAPGGSCAIGIAYSSVNGGTTTGQVNFNTNATPATSSVVLTGTSVVPAVRLIGLDSPINFGDQIVGTSSAAVTPSIRNTGTAPLTVSGLSVTGANAGDFVLAGACPIIPVGGSCSVSLTFNPTAVGVRNAQINVLSNAVNATTSNTIALTGNGIPAPAPRVDFNITAIAFGNTIFGGAAPSQVVTLTNGGTLPLAVQSLLSSPEFVQMNNCPATLAPQQTCSVMISFTPLGLGQREGELILTSNTATSPNRIPLTGVGCRWFSPAGTRLFVSLCGN